MGVTTKSGDQGFTDLAGGRVPKDDPRIEALGALDELDAFLAEAWAALATEPAAPSSVIPLLAETIDAARKELCQRVMPFLATAGPERLLPKLKEGTAFLEGRIAALEEQYPSGGFFYSWTKAAALKLNTARTICRRTERRMAACAPGAASMFLNRLSDLLFLMALAAEKGGCSAGE
jgi:cob(I)alamin adenosyltransferase